MNLNLPSKVTDFVKGHVAEGRHSSEEDAIVVGIQLLMGREQLRDTVRMHSGASSKLRIWDAAYVGCGALN